jgi:hypothetical protein
MNTGRTQGVEGSNASLSCAAPRQVPSAEPSIGEACVDASGSIEIKAATKMSVREPRGRKSDAHAPRSSDCSEHKFRIVTQP